VATGGTSGSAAGGTSGSGTGGRAGSGGSGGMPRPAEDDDDGCGCRVPGAPARADSLGWLAALGLVVAARRRGKRAN
jgi:MYXO-CTERM domain-containing protein